MRSRALLAEAAVAAGLLLAGALPFWAGRFLPFLDMPQHLGLAAVLLGHGEPAAGFARTYQLTPGVNPYWGYLGPMWLLGRVLTLEVANKVLFSLWAVALPASVGLALRALGRDWRWAAFSLPLVWNANLFFGFAAFLVSMPLFFAALALAARALSDGGGGRRQALGVGAAAAAVFLAHVQSYLLLGLCVGALLLLEWRGWRWAARRAAPYVPSVGLFAAWALPRFVFPEAARAPLEHTPRYQGYGSLADLGASFEAPAEVLSRIPERLWGAYGDGSDHRTGAVLLVLFLLAVALAGWPDRDAVGVPSSGPAADPEGKGRGSLRLALRERRGELLAVIVLAAYLVLPFSVAGQWYLSPRYLVFAALLAPAFLAGRAEGGRMALVGAAAALALFADANAARKVAAFQRQARGFGEVLERMEPGRRALGLVFDRGDGNPVRQPAFLHFAAYYQALRGGDVGFSFAGLPSIPIRYRQGAQAPHPNEWSPRDFDWESMAPHYDYFLIRGWAVGGAAQVAERADLVVESNGWRLYRRRAADGSPPDPGGGP